MTTPVHCILIFLCHLTPSTTGEEREREREILMDVAVVVLREFVYMHRASTKMMMVKRRIG